MATLHLDVHGERARIVCADEETLARIADDFSSFHAPSSTAESGALELVLIRENPNYQNLPPLRASVHTPRNVCFTEGDVTYLDYFGKALAVYNRAQERIEVQCDGVHLLHEIAYLTLLSRLGERLERHGLHRVHALAVAAADDRRSAILLLPSTGGKTTLALRFLKGESGFRLVSEDSPLVDHKGLVYPFALRLGLLADAPPPFPPEFVTYAERMEFAPKYLVSMRAFPGAIQTHVTEPAWLFLGTRTLGRECRIAEAGRWLGFKRLVREMIVGVGLYQGVEFLLRTSVLDLLASGRLLTGRLQAALALLSRVRVFEIELGRDIDVNVSTLVNFLREQQSGTAR